MTTNILICYFWRSGKNNSSLETFVYLISYNYSLAVVRLSTLNLFRQVTSRDFLKVINPVRYGEAQHGCLWEYFELSIEDEDQRREPEAESQVRSTSDDVLNAVSIPAYETHRWKEDICSPNLDGNLAQGENKI